MAALLLDAYSNDDSRALIGVAITPRSGRSIIIPMLALMFLDERAIRDHAKLVLQCDELAKRAPVANLDRVLAIARAPVADDDAALAAAIDDAEAHGLVPHAARMRIVLAERTGDPTQLERARPVLQRLGDRQFLRRLEEVAAAIVPAP